MIGYRGKTTYSMNKKLQEKKKVPPKGCAMKICENETCNYNVTIMAGGQMRNCDNFKLLPKTDGRKEA